MPTLTPEAPEKHSSSPDDKYGFDPIEVGRMGGVYAKNQEEIDRRQASMRNGQSLKDRENDAGNLQNKSEAEVTNQEQKPAGHINNFTGAAPKQSRKDRLVGFVKGSKKKGPVAAIISIAIVGFVGVITLSPSLLAIHVVETITEGMNMQSGSMEVRTAKVYASMMKSTSGFCASKVSMRCKFRSMNDSQIKKLEDAGIKVIVNESETILGRKKIDGLMFNDKRIDASSLSMELKSNEKFREASREAYNPRFAGFADKVWAKVAGIFKISKKSILGPELKTDEERTKKVQETTKNGQSSGEIGDVYTKDKDSNEYMDKDGNVVSEEEAIKANATAAETATDLKTIIGEVDQSGEKLTPKVLSAAEDALEHPEREFEAGSITKSLMGGVLQAPDSACTFYGLYNAVSFGAKTIRAVQMARYAMIFLNTASAMKAGQISPEDATYIGNLLTKTVKKSVTDAEGKISTITTKAATDSYGYKYVAYGDAGPLTPSATEFLAGGGLGGKMTGFANGIISLFPGGKKDLNSTCKIIKNPFVQAGSAVLSVGLIFTGPVGWSALASSLALGVAANTALSIATDILTPMITDMVAGVLVDNSTFGEATGDALVSGSGVIMSTLAGQGGNAPLKPDQAVAYMSGPQNDAIALYKEEDRASRSPFDPSSPNTFVGALVSKLIPYNNKMSSLTSILTTSFAITSRSLKSLINPSAFAAENSIATYTQCDDEDYKRLGLATDPFCNPIRGIPSQYLQDDPVDIINRLMESGNESVDDDGKPRSDTPNGQEYSKFIKDCIDRESPLGYAGEDFKDDDGSKCFIENSDGITAQMKADWYVFNIDQRILDGIDNGYVTGTTLNCGPFNSNSGGSVGGKITETEFKQQLASYGLPEPKAETEGDNLGYTALLDKLKSNPNAGWGAQQLLNGEKKWKAAGGDVKEYMNTAWVWYENGSSGWPDPYEINCNDGREGFASEVSSRCSSTNFQVAGFQAYARKGDYVEVFKKLYSDDQLPSILQQVVTNSSKSSKAEWNYNDSGQQKDLVSSYLADASKATLDDISPNKDFFGEKAQFLTLLLGKDPNMAAALNSFEVTDSDAVQAFRDCNVLGWSSYICGTEPLMSNMMMALYMFDGSGPSGDASNCADDSGGAKAPNDRDNDSLGIQSIVKGSVISTVYEMKDGGEDCGLYEYALQYGLDSCIHTGTDILVPPEAPLYTPVSGTVTCAGTNIGPGTKGGGCAAFADLYGQGNGRIEIEMPSGDVLILGHTSTSIVTAGQQVKAGQQVGTNGGMNSWHVHVEYRIPDSTPSGWRIIYPESGLGGKAIPNVGIGPTP